MTKRHKRISVTQKIWLEAKERINMQKNNVTRKNYTLWFRYYLKFARENFNVRSLSDCADIKILQTYADKLLAEAVKTAIDAAFPDGKAVGLRDMHGEDCYTVLYRTTVPSVLIEIGFISNAGDAARLTDATFRTTFADAVCNAIDAYFGAPTEE